MELCEKRDVVIYINMFVHYPQTFNANTISNKFNVFFKEYFIDSVSNQECYVMINSAPHNETELLKIEVCFDENVTLINKENMILKLKEFVINYFNNQIKDLNVEFLSDE